MLHSVGVNQPDASVFIRSWNSPSFKSACVHGFIDANSGTVYQTLPWTTRGWHAGSSANNTHIGVEMCEPSGIKYTRGSSKFNITGDIQTIRKACQTTYNSAVRLFAQLCEEFKLDPKKPGTIISHAEGHKLGVASNHGDPEHIWSKPALNLGYTMNGFRRDVEKVMLQGDQNGSDLTIPSAPFKVRITKADELWIRTGPGMQYPFNEKQKFIATGVFTIVSVENGFGKLKSGVGWINLNHPVVRILDSAP